MREGVGMTDFSDFPLYIEQYHKEPLPIGKWDLGGGLVLIIEQGTKHIQAVDRRISIRVNGSQVVLTDLQWAYISATLLHNESMTRPPPQKGGRKKLEYLESCMNEGFESATERHAGLNTRTKYRKPVRLRA